MQSPLQRADARVSMPAPRRLRRLSGSHQVRSLSAVQDEVQPAKPSPAQQSSCLRLALPAGEAG